MATRSAKTKAEAKAPKGRTVRFSAVVSKVGERSILRLPAAASEALPSRGQVAVHGAIAGHELTTVIEPDGERGHWMNLDEALLEAAEARPGDRVEVKVAPAARWPEPQVPADLASALQGAPPEVRELWQAITPMARWEWVRWVKATKNASTRQRRVEVSLSKLSQGKRRPCCFNLASCTDPELARSGKLAIR